MRLLNVFRLVITYFVTFNKHLKSQLRDSLSGFIIVLVHSSTNRVSNLHIVPIYGVN